MAHDFITNKILEDTADAIRYCEDSSAQIAPKDFAARIRELKYPKPESLNFYMPEGGTVILKRNGNPTTVTLEYSVDNGNTWTTWTESSNIRSMVLSAGQTMHVHNASETNTGFSTSNSDYYKFSFTTATYAGGAVSSLLCRDPSILHSSEDLQYVFAHLFQNCTTLISASRMTIENNKGFSALRYMFSNCSRLETPPESLIEISEEGCYGMFSGCSSLKKTPILYDEDADDSMCYAYMFEQCNGLKEVRTYMKSVSGLNALKNWLYRVSNAGDFYCPSELTITTGASGIPSGWTRHDI